MNKVYAAICFWNIFLNIRRTNGPTKNICSKSAVGKHKHAEYPHCGKYNTLNFNFWHFLLSFTCMNSLEYLIYQKSTLS